MEDSSEGRKPWFTAPKPSKLPRPQAQDDPSESPDTGLKAEEQIPSSPKMEDPIETRTSNTKKLEEYYATIESQPPSRAPLVGEVVLGACNELYADLLQCMVHGSWWEKSLLCESQAGRFWKCADDYKYVLRNMGYDRPIVTDKQRQVMAGEAVRIVKEAWALENDGKGRPDLKVAPVDLFFNELANKH